MSDEAPQKKQAAGAPAWVMTFADLMSLLMCFFVLLLSFSEMDVSKYKQIAGSMREAFGVQRKYNVKEPPKGINIIATEFSAGRPDPTPFNIMEQMTTDTLQLHLDTGQDRKKRDQGEEGRKGGGEQNKSGSDTKVMGENKQQGKDAKASRELVALPKADALKALKARAAERQKKAAADARAKAMAQALREKTAAELKAALKEEIKGGMLEVETTEQRIIIRLNDKASFPGGSVYIRDSFRPVLSRIGRVLKTAPGNIVVAGHSDDTPYMGDIYRSNWELSAGRAVSVVHELIAEADLRRNRITVEGKGDTQPLVPNDSPANRSRNRRVEIILAQGEDLFADSELASDTEVRAQPVAPADEVPVETPAADPAESGSPQNDSAPPEADPFIQGGGTAVPAEPVVPTTAEAQATKPVPAQQDAGAAPVVDPFISAPAGAGGQ